MYLVRFSRKQVPHMCDQFIANKFQHRITSGTIKTCGLHRPNVGMLNDTNQIPLTYDLFISNKFLFRIMSGTFKTCGLLRQNEGLL